MTVSVKMSTTATVAFAGSEMDTATNITHSSPAKSRKSFGISRKASAIKLSGSSHEKNSTHHLSQFPDTMPVTVPKEKKGSSGFLSYFFRPFRSQKSSPNKKVPHTTALEQTEFSPAPRKEHKYETEAPLSKAPSLPSTPHASRFSQALFVPPMESSIPPQLPVSRNSTDSPCLFVAFEQAIKSCVLTAPLIPPELIVKYSQEHDARSERRSRFVRKGSLSRSLEVAWAQKLFVLTPGLLIQYPCEGSYDREPERVLKLRPDSLTFATDIFEGKHFVLQITSGGMEVPTLTPDERRPSLISRALPKARFDAHVVLLVFEGAEEMQDWLVKIRKEISRLGGPSIEEHPIPSSRAGTIMEEEYPSKTPASSRKNSTSGRKSDEIATSASTAISQDGLVLDSLRTNSNNSVSSERRGSQISLNTSPERSMPDVFDKRYSIISTSHSYSSTDLRIRSRPVSTTLGTEHTASERPPSPTLTQVSSSSFARRRSRGNLPPPIPIPVPSIPKRYSSAGSSVGDLPSPVDLAHRRARRHRKSSAPPSPDHVIQLLSTSLPNPKSPPPVPIKKNRPRPVSLAAAPVTPRKEKSQNQNRRSVGSLSSSASVHGPPLHPPPSVPLPKLPDGSKGNLPKVPFNLLSPYQQGVPPVPQIPIPIPHSPLALHSQSAADVCSVGRKLSIASLSRA
ncbi:hypothetical protein TWF730_010970 [Orbilia blumenaviensis]|uniref:PH domain-containing protein n=1 Tax=Orbilia blumenaviensis TaxID=1796055 RepID=A0AAV9ULA5_9PEZI